MKKYFRDIDINNVFTLEKLVSDEPNKFLTIIKNFVEGGKLKNAIKMVKISGFCLSKYSGVRKKNYKNLLKLLSSYSFKFELIKFKYEIDIFDRFYSYFLKEKKEVLEKIPYKENHLMIFILGIESLFRKSLPINVIKKNSSNDNEFLLLLEGWARSKCEYTSYIYLTFIEMLKKTNQDFNIYKKIDDSDVVQMQKWIELLDSWLHLEHMYDLWAYLDSTFIIGDGDVKVEIGDHKSLEKWMISNLRNRQWRLSQSLAASQKLKNKKFFTDTYELPPKVFRSEKEWIGGLFLHGYLYSNDLKEECSGVKLAEWLRAYQCISDHASKILDMENKNDQLTIKSCCDAKSKSDWIDFFIENGISKKSAPIVFNQMVFGKSSQNFFSNNDMLDKPIINVNENYVLIPSIAAQIEYGVSVVGTLKDKDIFFKGKNFERFIRNNLKEAGIESISCQATPDHELDIMFKLGDYLFIIECKCMMQPYGFKKHFSNDNQTDIFSRKLNNHCDFILKNKKEVFKQLGKDECWIPRKVIKIILFSYKVGSANIVNDCYVSDSSIFYQALFGKGAFELYDKVSVKEKIVQNRLNEAAELLIEEISNPFIIGIMEKQCQYVSTTHEVSQLKLTFDIVHKFTPDIMDAEGFRKILKKDAGRVDKHYV